MPVIPLEVRHVRDELLALLDSLGKPLSEEVCNTEVFEGYALIVPGDIEILMALSIIKKAHPSCQEQNIPCVFELSIHSLPIEPKEHVTSAYSSVLRQTQIFIHDEDTETSIGCDGCTLTAQEAKSVLSDLLNSDAAKPGVHLAIYIEPSRERELIAH